VNDVKRTKMFIAISIEAVISHLLKDFKYSLNCCTRFPKTRKHSPFNVLYRKVKLKL